MFSIKRDGLVMTRAGRELPAGRTRFFSALSGSAAGDSLTAGVTTGGESVGVTGVDCGVTGVDCGAAGLGLRWSAWTCFW